MDHSGMGRCTGGYTGTGGLRWGREDGSSCLPGRRVVYRGVLGLLGLLTEQIIPVLNFANAPRWAIRRLRLPFRPNDICRSMSRQICTEEPKLPEVAGGAHDNGPWNLFTLRNRIGI